MTVSKLLWGLSVLGVGVCIDPCLAMPIQGDGTETQVIQSDGTFSITGGVTSSDRANLFHSFERFGLEAGQTADFVTPSAVQNVLGRVVGGDPSIIDGALRVSGSNANLFLLNPAGVVFGPNASLDVPRSFAATTAGAIAFGEDNWFEAVGPFNGAALKGDPTALRFDGMSGSIVNFASLAVSPGSSIAFTAANVLNFGTLTAPGGQATIAAVPGTNLARISPAGSLLSLEIPFERVGVTGMGGVSEGVTLPDLLTGSGLDVAQEVEVTPEGNVRLVNADVVLPYQEGIATSSGEIDVSNGNGVGGSVEVLGPVVGLLGAQIDASGRDGGGQIRVGGDYLGLGEIPNSQITFVDGESSINVNALTAGDGGRSIFWSDGATQFLGEVTATGGSSNGNGGFVEVSGKNYLDFQGIVDTTTSSGDVGILLLDPQNITITSERVETSDLANVSILSAPDIGNDGETRLSPVAIETASSNVILKATRNVLFYFVDISIAQEGIGISVEAGNNINLSGSKIHTNGGDIQFKANSDNSEIGGVSLYNSEISTGGGDITIDGDIEDRFSNLPNAGVLLFTSSLDGGGGNIIITGNNDRADLSSPISNVIHHGIEIIDGSQVKTSGTGNIRLFGTTHSTSKLTQAPYNNDFARIVRALRIRSSEVITEDGDIEVVSVASNPGQLNRFSPIKTSSGETIHSNILAMIDASFEVKGSGDIILNGRGGNLDTGGGSGYVSQFKTNGGDILFGSRFSPLSVGNSPDFFNWTSDFKASTGDVSIVTNGGDFVFFSTHTALFTSIDTSTTVDGRKGGDVLLESETVSVIQEIGSNDAVAIGPGEIRTQGKAGSGNLTFRLSSLDPFSNIKVAFTSKIDTSSTAPGTDGGDVSIIISTPGLAGISMSNLGINTSGARDAGDVRIESTRTSGTIDLTGGPITALGGRNGGDITIIGKGYSRVLTADIVTSSSGFTGNSGNIRLSNELDAIDTSAGTLITSAGNGTGGNIELDSSQGTVSVAGLNAVSLSRNGGSISIDAKGGVTLAGTLMTNQNSIEIDGTVTLKADSQLISQGLGRVDIAGLVNGPFDFAVIAPSSMVFFGESLNQGSLLNDVFIQAEELVLPDGQTFSIQNTGDLNIATDVDLTGGLELGTTGGSVTARDISTVRPGISGSVRINAAGAIRTGNIRTEGMGVGAGGNIHLETWADGSIRTGDIRTSSPTQSGSLSLASRGDITTGSISTEVSPSGVSSGSGMGGFVTVETGGNFRVLDSQLDAFGQPASIATFGPEGSGFISITHGGNGDVPFVIGDASVNGTAARIQRSDLPEGIIQQGNQYFFTHRQDGGGIQIVSVDGTEPIAPAPAATGIIPSPVSSPPPADAEVIPAPSSDVTPTEPPEAVASTSDADPDPLAIAPDTTDPDTTDTESPATTESSIEPTTTATLPGDISPGPSDVAIVEPMVFPGAGLSEPPILTGDTNIDLANLIGNLIGFETSFQTQGDQLGITWTGEDGTTITQGVPLSTTESTPIAIAPSPLSTRSLTATTAEPSPTTLPAFQISGDLDQDEITTSTSSPDFSTSIQDDIGFVSSAPATDSIPDLSSLTTAFGLPSTAADVAALVTAGNAEDAVTIADAILEAQYEDFYGQDFANETVTIASIQELLISIEEETGDRGTIVYAVPWKNQLSLIAVSAHQAPALIQIDDVNLNDTIDAFVESVSTEGSLDFESKAQNLYKLITEPLEEHFEGNGTTTAIFALHGEIQGIPLAALHDGEQYLIEKMNVALIPSVSLTDKRYTPIHNARLLAMGTGTFAPSLRKKGLPSVPIELETITTLWDASQKVADQDFTLEQLLGERQRNEYRILHLATHAEFEAREYGERDRSQPTLYFWDQGVGLGTLRENQWVTDDNPLELLVLSACDTILGDYREFGFGGLAVNSGAKSVIGSRWKVSDAATLALMSKLYQFLGSEVIKAKALRQAQLSLLWRKVRIENHQLVGVPEALLQAQVKARSKPDLGVANGDFSHPYYWASFGIVSAPW